MTQFDLAVKGQSKPRVIIKISFVELESPMLHAKFPDHRILVLEKKIFFKVFAIYGHGGHLGHVTWTIYINFRPPLPKEAPHKIWL